VFTQLCKRDYHSLQKASGEIQAGITTKELEEDTGWVNRGVSGI
jgi:hypothetical protein